MTVFKTARGQAALWGGDGREEPTGQLHTRLDREVIEIRDILEWGGGSSGGDHQFRGCGFSGRGFHTRGCFLICLPSCRLSGCCRLCLGPALFLVAVTLGCEGASVTGWGVGLGFVVGVVVALTTRPPRTT